MSKRILIIGSGAVGAVFAHHLACAGCEVSFLVRDAYSRNSLMPRNLHQYRVFGAPKTIRQQVAVHTRAVPGWDQLWLTLPSDALDSSWLVEQLAVFSADTPLLSWTPDFRDREKLQRLFSGPIQHGLIGLSSFHTPLPGTTEPGEGFGYFLPPRAAILDNSSVGKEAAAILRAGGLPAAVVKDLVWLAARSTALMVPSIAALELAGWSLARYRQDNWVDCGCSASREATVIAAAYLDRNPGVAARLPQPVLMRTASWLAPMVMPFPLEIFLQSHFSKVGEQTRLMLDHWIEEGNLRSLPTRGLRALRDRL